MPETGINWREYDRGPGSEHWKRKMAEEERQYQKEHGTLNRLIASTTRETHLKNTIHQLTQAITNHLNGTLTDQQLQDLLEKIKTDPCTTTNSPAS